MKRIFAIVAGCVALCAAGLLGVTADAREAYAAPSGHATAMLEADVSALQPGRPIWVALRLDLEPHWHTYWRNPGDAGLAPRVTFELPPGFQQGPLLWPAPSSFTAGGLTSYGYEGTVRLLTRITPPAALASPGSVRIVAHVQWMACQEVCVMGKADLSLDLQVSPSTPSAASRALQGVLDTLPAGSPALRPHAWRTANGGLVLAFTEAHPLSRAAFYPAEPLRVEPSAAQSLRRGASGWTLDLQPGPSPGDRLDGVLELFVEGREKPVAYTISVPVEAPP